MTEPRATWTVQNKDKTHCKHGHEFTDQNTYRNNGKRFCRICLRNATVRWKQRKAAAND